MEESRRTSLLADIITWIVVGTIALVALKIAIGVIGVLAAVFGAVLGALLTLALTVAPLALLGWLVVKLIGRLRPTEEE